MDEGKKISTLKKLKEERKNNLLLNYSVILALSFGILLILAVLDLNMVIPKSTMEILLTIILAVFVLSFLYYSDFREKQLLKIIEELLIKPQNPSSETENKD